MNRNLYAHCLVKNEERFLWYSVSSVINFVDKILIWDTGSTDNTLKIIDLLRKKYPEKIVFKNYGSVDSETFFKARQDMLDNTNSDWFLVLDADEIWWDDSIRKLTSFILKDKGKNESIVVPTINLIGDIFFFLEEKAGRYKFGKRKGHYNLRAIRRNISGLKSFGKHGVWGWVDENGKMIQDRNQEKIVFLDTPYLHASFLQRGGTIKDDKKVVKRLKKFKYELGEKFPLDFYYPEVFFKARPEIVPSVWKSTDFKYKLRASIETPFKKIKRRIYYGKTGY